MSSVSSPLESSPSDVPTATTPPATAPEADVLTEFAKLLQKLTAKEVTLKALIDTLDAKELTAARKYHVKERKDRWLKKLGEARWANKLSREEQLRRAELTEEERLEEERREEERREEERLEEERLEEEFQEKKRRIEKLKVREQVLKEVDLELGDPVVPQCYQEIKHLLYIEKDPVFAKALEEWSRKELLFTSRVERKKSKAAALKNEIYQLIGFFSVFQGVLLTAVSQSNLLHCNNLWSPIFLSVVASVVTIFGVFQKLSEIKKYQITIHSEEQSLKEVAGRLSKLRKQGVEGFEFARFAHREDKEESNIRSNIYFWLVIASLIIFTVGFPISHWRILCDSGDAPYATKVQA